MRVLSLVPVVLVSGCIAVGNTRLLDPTIVDRIVVGKSTREDVRDLLGDPSNVTQHSGFFGGNTEVWTYSYYRTDVDGRTFIPIAGIAFAGQSRSDMRILIVNFRPDGIVLSKMSSASISRPDQPPKGEAQGGPARD